MNNTLEIDGIQLSFAGRKVLSSIYVKCETGKITGLLGRNGQGKSCLMQIIYGSLPCEKSVRFNGISIVEGFKKPTLLRYLPQFNFIPASLTVQKVLRNFKLEYKQFQEQFPEFTDKGKVTIGSLSGGERRLIELYVIVKSASQFAMLDEPFTHLNPIQIEKVKQLLIEEKANKGLFITDHMYKHITDIADNLYVLTNGQTYLTKNIEEIQSLGYAKLSY